MILKSNKLRDKEWLYLTEKRKSKRVPFNLEIFYPQVNKKSIRSDIVSEDPILLAIDLSEQGICFQSKLNLNEGDFISFLMKISNNPSFPCLAVVRWQSATDDSYIAGCEFCSLDWTQLKIIMDYCESIKIAEK